MPEVVDIEKARLELKAKKGFKRWTAEFECPFGISTRMKDIPDRALAFLAKGSHKSSLSYYDLIISLKDMGHGSGFDWLGPPDKMTAIDIYLFLLDRTRYEYMKRLEWLTGYPGEEYPLVELVINFNDLAPNLQARPPDLSRSHPDYGEYISGDLYEKEQIIRKLIPEALEKISL